MSNTSEIDELVKERDELLSIVKDMASLFRYVNCVCGRNKPRLPNNLREKIEAVIRKKLNDHENI